MEMEGLCMCMTMAKDSLKQTKENKFLDEYLVVIWQVTGVQTNIN